MTVLELRILLFLVNGLQIFRDTVDFNGLILMRVIINALLQTVTRAEVADVNDNLIKFIVK